MPDTDSPKCWPEIERRGPDGMALRMMGEMRALIAAHEERESRTFEGLKAEIRENREESDARHAEAMRRFGQMQASTTELLQANNLTVSEIHKMFKEAFPEGDVRAHREAHEKWMAKDAEDRAFWLKLKQSVVNWAVIAALGWGGIALWAAFIKGPHS